MTDQCLSSISNVTRLGRGSTGWDSRRSVAWGCGWNTLCRGSPGRRLFSQLGAKAENGWKLEEISSNDTTSRYVYVCIFLDSIPSFSPGLWPSKLSLQSLSLWSCDLSYLIHISTSLNHHFYHRPWPPHVQTWSSIIPSMSCHRPRYEWPEPFHQGQSNFGIAPGGWEALRDEEKNDRSRRVFLMIFAHGQLGRYCSTWWCFICAVNQCGDCQHRDACTSKTHKCTKQSKQAGQVQIVFPPPHVLFAARWKWPKRGGVGKDDFCADSRCDCR